VRFIDFSKIISMISFIFKVLRIVINGNLKILEIDTNEIVAIGITNQRETTLLWNKKSGEVFNPLIWSDTRLLNIRNAILARTKNKKNYLRAICGLPFDM
jgi:glycerol kinase